VPGSYGYYKSDMDQMVSWGMDYVKVDSCGGSQTHSVAFQEYGQIRDYLNATGRPVFFSLCGWESWYAPVGWSLGNSWRIDGDGDNWGDILNIFDTMSGLSMYASPGGWNDADLLIGTGVGSYGPSRGGWYITDLQSRTQFSTYAVMSAPLLISADIGNVSAYALETWTNAEVIAVNQNPGRHPQFPYQGTRLAGGNFMQGASWNVWGRALNDGSFAVVFINNGANAMNITCNAACFAQMQFQSNVKLTVRDLFLHKTVAIISPGTYTAINVPGNGGSSIFRFYPQSKKHYYEKF